jgi:hypothetical protein
MPGLTLTRAVRLCAVGLVTDRRERIGLPPPVRAPLGHRFRPTVRRPIFVLGAPRSGTTFLGSCVAALPDVSYHFEPRLTKALARSVYDGSLSPSRARWQFRAYYGALLALAGHGGLRFAEKDPENCFIVPFLLETFPDAVFLHVVRDGRDVAVSHAEQPWTASSSSGSGRRGRGGSAWGPDARFWVEPERRGQFPTVSDIRRSAWMWRRFTSAALHHLAALPPDRVLHLRYEAVVAAPSRTAERVATFLETDPTGREALQTAFANARRSSVGRWARRLDAAALAEVEEESGDLLRELGYIRRGVPS